MRTRVREEKSLHFYRPVQGAATHANAALSFTHGQDAGMHTLAIAFNG